MIGRSPAWSSQQVRWVSRECSRSRLLAVAAPYRLVWLVVAVAGCGPGGRVGQGELAAVFGWAAGGARHPGRGPHVVRSSVGRTLTRRKSRLIAVTVSTVSNAPEPIAASTSQGSRSSVTQPSMCIVRVCAAA